MNGPLWANVVSVALLAIGAFALWLLVGRDLWRRRHQAKPWDY